MVFPLKRILAFMPGSFLVALSGIDIEREDENGLVLDADGWRVVFDKPSQAVSYSGRPFASFSSLDCITVKHFVNGICPLGPITGLRFAATTSPRTSLPAGNAPIFWG